MADVGQDEGLWRSVFDSKRAKKAEVTMSKYQVADDSHEIGLPQSRHVVIAKGFEERAGVSCISVDRLDCANLVEEAIEGDRRAKNRSASSQGLHGWLVVKAKHARQQSRSVVSSPSCDNPWPADIVLPAKAANNPDERRQHAQQLASYSNWMPRPVCP